MKIAIEGCCHGELDAIYARVAELEKRNKYTVDLLLICGDFQAIRNPLDLGCMSVPQKYKRLGGFHKYYTGETHAPVLTIIIGGNHEASNYLWELYHGGWLAPNIYFLGHAGCVRVNGIRIAGASGIFKSNDFRLGHYERLPYTVGSMKSIYHIREYNVRRLSLLGSPDLFLSHDWPAGIEHHGDLPMLLKRKPFFKSDIAKGELGSPPLTNLLHTLRPAHWFSAHLHTRFTARVVHTPAADAPAPALALPAHAVVNPDEIAIDLDDDDMPTPSSAPATANPDEIAIDFDEDGATVPTSAPAALALNPDEIGINLDDEGIEAQAASALLDITVRAPGMRDSSAAASAGAVDALLAEIADAAATVPSVNRLNPDEITLDDEEFDVETPAPVIRPAAPAPAPAPATATLHAFPFGAAPGSSEVRAETHFLALDKCMPRRDYLEVIDYPPPPGRKPPPLGEQPDFAFDREWLAIARAFNLFFARAHQQAAYPPEAEARTAIADARAWVDEHVFGGDVEAEKAVGSVQTFVVTAPGGNTHPTIGSGSGQPVLYQNPQTQAFCDMLGMENKVT